MFSRAIDDAIAEMVRYDGEIYKQTAYRSFRRLRHLGASSVQRHFHPQVGELSASNETNERFFVKRACRVVLRETGDSVLRRRRRLLGF